PDALGSWTSGEVLHLSGERNLALTGWLCRNVLQVELAESSDGDGLTLLESLRDDFGEDHHGSMDFVPCVSLETIVHLVEQLCPVHSSHSSVLIGCSSC